jgi:hypothetical protein
MAPNTHASRDGPPRLVAEGWAIVSGNTLTTDVGGMYMLFCTSADHNGLLLWPLTEEMAAVPAGPVRAAAGEATHEGDAAGWYSKEWRM